MSWTRASKALVRAAAVLAGGCAGIVLLPGAGVARAQGQPGDAPLAETLFDDAKKDMAAGDFAAACPKLAESYRLDPGTGTLTALAVCHESTGKTASAWTEFIEVVSEARQASRADREKFAQQRIHALEPKLSKLTIQVDPSVQGLPGLEVKRDGSAVGPAGWATAAPVDPGDHTVEARATGKKPWSVTVKVGPDADQQTVTVPALDDLPVEAAGDQAPGMGAGGEGPAVPGPAEDRIGPAPGHTQRIVGGVFAGAGLVAAGVGTYFGLVAISKNNDATARCGDPSRCFDPTAVGLSHDARSAAVGADVAFGGAAALLVAGALVYFLAPAGTTSPAASTATVDFTPVVSPRAGAVLMTARLW